VSISLTVACAVAAVVDLQTLAGAALPEMRGGFAAHPWANGIAAGAVVLQLGSLVALWLGRRAGLFSYLALVLIQIALLASAGRPAACALVAPVLVAAAGAWNWERLR